MEEAESMRKKALRRVERHLINLMIDSMIHPIARKTKDPAWWIIDGLLHFINEYDLPPEKRIEKFIRYNLPPLLRSLGSAKRRRRRAGRWAEPS